MRSQKAAEETKIYNYCGKTVDFVVNNGKIYAVNIVPFCCVAVLLLNTLVLCRSLFGM